MSKRRVLTRILVMLGVVGIVGAQDKLYPDEFPLGDVQLLDGPLKTAMDLNVTYLLKYDVDRLLAPYLKDAGLPPKGADYTTESGWSGLSGHIGGHYLSALAMQYAATGDAQCKQRMDYMIAELKKCQDANGSREDFAGYVSGIPDGKTMWREYKTGNFSKYIVAWVPWYNIHKTYAGLRDAYIYGGSETAKTMFLELCDWGIKINSGLSDSKVQEMLGANALKEQGGINEIYADAYQLTDDEKYLDFAKRFSHKWLLDPLASGKDQLNDVHANAQVPKVVGFARIAELADDEYYRKAAEFFWTTVTQNRSVAIGGNSNNEYFQSSNMTYITGRQGVESCNTHNMLKLTEDLYRMSNDIRYIDFYEKALFNHILSTQNPVHGGYVYFTPTHPRHYRVYSAPDRDMWCCVGTGMENHTKYSQFIYTQQSESLFVNLFVASELDWKNYSVKIRQETEFPVEGKSVVTVSTDAQKSFRMFIRHPSWVPAGKMKVSINDEVLSEESEPSTYIKIVRTWNGGEKVVVEFPMNFDVEPLANYPEWVAIKRGPIILGAKTPTTDIPSFIANSKRMGHSPEGTLFDYKTAPKLSITGATFQSEFTPVAGKTLAYKAPGIFTNTADADLVFEPFCRIHDSRYMMYWNAEVNGEVVGAHVLPEQQLQPPPGIRQMRGKAMFSFATVDPSRRVVVYNLSGRQVADIAASSKTMELQYGKEGIVLNNGMYAVEIRSEGRRTSEKICVSK